MHSCTSSSWENGIFLNKLLIPRGGRSHPPKRIARAKVSPSNCCNFRILGKFARGFSRFLKFLEGTSSRSLVSRSLVRSIQSD